MYIFFLIPKEGTFVKKIACLVWLSLACFAYSNTRYVVKNNSEAVPPFIELGNRGCNDSGRGGRRGSL